MISPFLAHLTCLFRAPYPLIVRLAVGDELKPKLCLVRRLGDL